MTEGVKPVVPVQPTALTHNVSSVISSRFFAAIKLSSKTTPNTAKATAEKPQPESDYDPIFGELEDDDESDAQSIDTAPASPAPVVHLTNEKSTLLVDYPHGKGRIAVLSDPYIVANGGISLKTCAVGYQSGFSC